MKNTFKYPSVLLLLFVLFLVSCTKDVITEEPEAYYDKGERLMLSNNLVILNNSSLTHSGGQPGVLYDDSTKVLKLDESTVEMELDTGMVLHIDMDDDVLLRRIISLEKASGGYILQTADGNIADVFDDADLNFDFNPEFSNQVLQTKGLTGVTGEELTKALTDNKKRIHPSEVRMVIGNTEKLLFSVDKNIPLVQTKSASGSNKVGFEHKFNTDMTILSVGPVELVLEDFGFSWYSNLKANFYTEKKFHKVLGHKVYPPYYVAAKLDVTAEDMDIEASFDVAAVVEGELPLVNETDPLLLPVQMMFEFPVGAVPVMIGIEFALDLGIEISVDGEARATTGYTVKYNVPELMVGGYYSVENLKSHSGVTYNYRQGHIVEHHFHPLVLEAMANLKQVYTLKPTMGFSIYRIAGPEINLAIGAEFDFGVGGGVSVDLEHTGNAPEAYIGWDGKLSSKVGAGGGVWIDAFGVLNKHWDIPTLPLLPNIPIWHTPESMVNKTGNEFAHTIVGQEKQVEVEVKDSWTIPAPLMFVEWVSEGGGHWEHPITLTSLGTAKNKWIPSETGTHKPYCYVKNGKLKEVGRITFTTTTVAQ